MLYLLLPIMQAKLRFSGNLLGAKQETDPRTMYFTMAGFVVFFLAAFLMSKLLKGNAALRQHKRVFKKKAKELNLTKRQIKLLISFIKDSNIKKPLQVLTHPVNLNSLLRKAIRDIRKDKLSPVVKENRIVEIYRLKHHLDKYQRTSQVKTTHELHIGTKVLLERSDKRSYSSSVLGNYENFFSVKLPMDSVGSQIKWKKGTMVKVIAFDSNDKESTFTTKVLGIKNIGSSNAIIVAHTIKSTQNASRQHQRVDVSLSSYIYPVDRIYNKSTKKYGYKANRTIRKIGKVIDISTGGCCISMSSPYPEGSFIELEFNFDGKSSVKLQGKVLKLRINRGKKLTHVKFTRASAKNLNSINNFIYSLG